MKILDPPLVPINEILHCNLLMRVVCVDLSSPTAEVGVKLVECWGVVKIFPDSIPLFSGGNNLAGGAFFVEALFLD